MSVALVIPPRSRDLGEGMVVRRALPAAQKRMVGPFIFWDHMGPVNLTPDFAMVVRAHPHIGLATLTYLLRGQILHRDSLGNELAIRPGEVNWMTAGQGIVHSERSSAALFPGESMLEGIQLWIALPVSAEDRAPAFDHFKERDLPEVPVAGVPWRLIAGSFAGTRSPVPVYSPLFYLTAPLPASAVVALPIPASQEAALYVASGEVVVAGQSYGPGHLIVFTPGSPVAFSVAQAGTFFVFGGEPFPEKRLIWWNFVSSAQDKIDAAKERWEAQAMGRVPQEVDWIPLPPT